MSLMMHEVCAMDNALDLESRAAFFCGNPPSSTFSIYHTRLH